MCWIITETNQYDSQAIDRLGNKFLTGNGYIGYRGTLEEYTKDQKTATIVSGLYDQVGNLWREPINLPNGMYTQILYQGKPLHVLTAAVEKHAQCLNMLQATHHRRTIFTTEDGRMIVLHARRFASLAEPHLMCVEFSLQADRECQLVIQTGIDGDVWDLNGPHLENFDTSDQGGTLSLTAQTQGEHVSVAISERTVFPGEIQTIVREEKRILRQIPVTVGVNQPYIFSKFVGLYTGADSSNPLAESRQLAFLAARSGFEKAFRDHCARWEERWKACNIQIKGDDEAQQALRFSMYHLLAIAPTHADSVSIPARGLSGQMYRGAIFWDTEIFMMPFFNHAFPEISRNLLMYRCYTLAGARQKAKEYGFRGAFYAWESQDGGREACTLFNVTDVFTNRPLRTYFRDKQVHISADVVYAFWKYYTITGDGSIWLDGGAEVVYECARFLLSYVYYSRDRQRYEVLDVTGPDEYHERVHNNAFTNYMTAHTFEVCLRVSEYLQDHHPEQAQQLLDRLDFHGDLAAIREVAEAIYLPAPDPASGVIPQFDGYFSLEDVSLKELLSRKKHPNEYLGAGNGLATTTQILKQADVVLTMVLFNECFSQAVKATNWEYYETRTEHGSSLSACSYSLIAAQIGNVDYAYRYFMKTATIDLMGESKQYVGTLYIGGTHPAGNGGAWMSAVFGLCGIHCDGTTLSVDPHLPEHWKEIVVPVTFYGQKLRITLSHEAVRVEAVQPLTTPVSVRIGETQYKISQDAKLSVALMEEVVP